MLYLVFLILILIVTIALGRGYKLPDIFKMALPGIKDSFIVVGVLLLIGCLTGLWRSSGTIAYFVTFGIRVFPPSLFVLSAFLISSAMSLAIGTSFGVVATAGVILMSIARAAGIDLIPVAGAIMSGIYVGDRNSPAASSASLVATLTGTDLNENVRIMLKTSMVPLVVCAGIYTILSLVYPMPRVDSDTLSLLEDDFNLSWLCILPAVLMIILPFGKIKVKVAMTIDIIVSLAIAVVVQGEGMMESIKTMVLGYESADETLAALLDGGGIRSMLEVCVILLVSGCFGGILQGAGLLDYVYDKIDWLKGKIGRFATMIVISILSCMIFCNQTIGIMMVNQLSLRLYEKWEKSQKMIDIEDSVITLAGLIPWCIASSVPLTTMDVSAAALLFSFYLWFLPLWHLLRGKMHTAQTTWKI